MQNRAISPSDLVKELRANALADIPSMIWGPPGIGKSDIAYQFASSMNAKLFELRANLFDPVDVRGGLKVVEQEDGTYRTRYGVPEDYPDTDYQGAVVLFIDELPNAPKATQNALLQLLLNKRIGTYELPANTIIIAAGNRAQDRAAVHEMPTPVRNRFAHYTLEPTVDDWVKWAMNHGVHDSITSFIRMRPSLLHSTDGSDYAFPSPRTWAMLDRKLPHMADDFYGCSSMIGDGPAGEYLSYRAIYKDMPDIDQIIEKPSTTTVPTDTSVLFAVSGALASRATTDNFDSIMRFIRRMPAEYQVIAIRDSIAKQRDLVTLDCYQKWTTDNAAVLL
jgi:hypothetical protein